MSNNDTAFRVIVRGKGDGSYKALVPASERAQILVADNLQQNTTTPLISNPLYLCFP